MKQLIAVFLLGAMLVNVTACGNNNDTSAEADSPPPSTETEQSNDLEETPEETPGPESREDTGAGSVTSNTLIAYFSRVGNTEFDSDVDVVTSASLNVDGSDIIGNCQILADMAAEETGGDVFAIETVDKYPSDYRATTDRASVELSENARPALSSQVENMDQYDTIILIYPNWWGTIPMPLFTFLEEYDFAGKTILPLCAHEGSAMGSSARDITALSPDAQLLAGLAIRGGSVSSAQSDISNWLRKSGIVE